MKINNTGLSSPRKSMITTASFCLCKRKYCLISNVAILYFSSYPHENKKISTTYTTFWHKKIYFDDIGIYVKHISANICHFYKENICKIYFNYKNFF